MKSGPTPSGEVWIDGRLVVRRSAIEGRGLFFAEDMAADTVLIRLGGRLVTSTELDALIAAADAHPDLPYVDTITISSTPSDPEGAKVWDELQAERLRGMAMFAKALTEQGHLRPEVHATEARDVLWTYNSAELYQLLVIQRRWSAQRYGS